MRKRLLPLVAALAMLTACTNAAGKSDTPGLADRGTTMTTVKPGRQDVANKVSLTGKVALGPTFGLVAPLDGEVRYLDVQQPKSTPTKPTKVANVWVKGKATSVEVPPGAIFSGRLVDDHAKVTAGTPIVSAKYVGYGIVADIDSGQAYKIADNLGTVQAQIKNGPGPFVCTVLGTIAALPAGTIPEPSANPTPTPTSTAGQQGSKLSGQTTPQNPSEATGMRLVCSPSAGDVKLINGAAATVEVVTEKVANALVLPVEAVAGRQGNGKVDVVKADGSRETKDVVLGLTDGKVIEIKSGLTGDEKVAVPGPNLPKGQPNQDDGGKGNASAGEPAVVTS